MDEAPRVGLPAPLILVQFKGDPEPICAYWHSTMFGWVHDTGHGPFRIKHNPIGWLPLPDGYRPPLPIQKAARGLARWHRRLRRPVI